jgi:hypothetical protein
MLGSLCCSVFGGAEADPSADALDDVEPTDVAPRSLVILKNLTSRDSPICGSNCRY